MSLSTDDYRSTLKEHGFRERHSTKYAVEFAEPHSGEVVYINRSKSTPGLVVHPRHDHKVFELSRIRNLQFNPGKNHFLHNSNFKSFPERINKNDPIRYGLEFLAESKRACGYLLDAIVKGGGDSTILDEIESEREKLATKSETERDAIVKARLGQGPWRARLDELWSGCALTGCDIRQLLRGSHIKPWKDSSSEEKLDPNNGFLLRADVDALFDAGLITFRSDGTMQVSPHLTSAQVESLPFDISLRLRKLTPATKKYLEFHRNEVFKVVV